MLKKRIALFLSFFLALATVVLYAATFINRDLTRTLFSHAAYYLVFLLVLLWLFLLLVCLRQYKPDIKSFMKSYSIGLIICLVLTSIVFISVRPLFRVLSDETNLLAISKSMTYERRIDNVTMGKWYYDNFYPVGRQIPKRPLLFPFLAHMLHTLLGYRAENVFILNFIVLVSLLFLVFTLVKKHLGDICAFSSILLIASQPIVSQAATSGGFDLLFVLFLVISFASLQWFLKDPSPIRFQLLWMNLLMLVNIRYEGILTFAVVLFFLIFLKYVKMDFFKKGLSIIYLFTPLLLLSTFWQRLLTKNPFETEGIAFSAGYFVKHNIAFLKTFLHYDFFLPYATIVNLAGFLSLFFFGYLFLSGRLFKEKYQRHLILISAASLFANWLLYTAYHDGNITHPSTSRYYIAFFVLLSVILAMSLHRLRLFKTKPVNLVILSAVIFVLYHPVAVQDRFSRTQTLPREYRFVMNFLKKEIRQSRNFLVITKRPGLYTVHDYGAVNFDYANRDRSVMDEYKNHLYQDIFVIQDIEYKTGKPTQETQLNKNFVLEKVAESQNKALYFTCISKAIPVFSK